MAIARRPEPRLWGHAEVNRKAACAEFQPPAGKLLRLGTRSSVNRSLRQLRYPGLLPVHATDRCHEGPASARLRATNGLMGGMECALGVDLEDLTQGSWWPDPPPWERTRHQGGGDWSAM